MKWPFYNKGGRKIVPVQSVNVSQIPALTTEQMREVDRLMVEVHGIQLLQMMENAGRNLAELARRLLGGSVVGKTILLAAGKGNNGGGGMVAARHLSNWGAEVKVVRPPGDLAEVAELQWTILTKLPIEKRMGEGALRFLATARGDMILDALIGYGLAGKPRGFTAEVIQEINELACPVVSLDVPSGLDATTGEIYGRCVQATATVTLALPKTGLLKAGVEKIAGTLFLADIGVPDVVYRELGIETGPIFLHDTLVKLEA